MYLSLFSGFPFHPTEYALQRGQSFQMDNLIYFYNTLSFYLIIILTVVAWMLFQAIFNYSNLTVKTAPYTSGRVLEFIWTSIPTLVLVSVAIMSFSLLYMMDDVVTPDMTVKVIGHQWYWSYEYFNPITLQYIEQDSYLVPESDLSYGFRMLETAPIVLPKNMTVRFLVTAADVLHSWALPSLGIKIDAVPGRLNQVYVNTSSGIVAYGQCSELCGVHHGFMPIKVKIRG